MALDRTLICKNCGKDFIFSASEQEFFASKGLTNEPSKCKDCRRKARAEKEARQVNIRCTHCGKQEHVTFTVTHPETLLCDDCFQKLRPKTAAPPVEVVEQSSQPEIVDLSSPTNTLS